MRLVWAEVTGAAAPAGGAQRLQVAFDDGEAGEAIAYPRLSGECAIGGRVLLNTTAVDLSLGTGGLHFVVAREPVDGETLSEPSGGHLMKMRYAPLQVDVLGVEEGRETAEAMRGAEDLGGMPVVCCGLHSQMSVAAAAIKAADASLRVAYCMIDFASLPFALSEVAREAVDAGLLDTTITCGQAFGAEIEAVNLHSGLLAARHVAEADVTIVAIGPGMVGTATPYGHGGVAQGESINAVAALGGKPVAALRISFADPRERHRVLSHHTIVALSKVALARATVAVPLLPSDQAEQIEAALGEADVWRLHERAEGSATEIPTAALRGIQPRSMRRTLADDPAFFLAAYSAGEVAAALASA